MTTEPTPIEQREQLARWFAAAVEAVEPERATRLALERAALPSGPPGILAFGKAAHGMARAAIAWLDAHHIRPAGGLIVSHQENPVGRMPLDAVVGDHPVPGAHSRAASERLAATIAGLPDRAPVLVFLSGGSSSLLAAPLEGITPDELAEAFTVFHELGLPIHAMNALRRQLTRWSGGRLAAALDGRDVRAWVISDVIDNDLAVIGSGPLVGGEVDAGTLGRVIAQPDLVRRVPAAVMAALAAGPPRERGTIPHHLVADRTTAGEAAVRAARADGVRATLHERPLVGDSVAAATWLGEWVRAHVRRHRLRTRPGIDLLVTPPEPWLHAWTGETTVRLPDDPGHGGRAQHLALVMARRLGALAAAGVNVGGITVLAAGTDGRDGPTDAAGAVIDGNTADRIAAAGIDIDESIARCDAYPALDAVGALLRTGSTGTNVADIVMVLGWSRY